MHLDRNILFSITHIYNKNAAQGKYEVGKQAEKLLYICFIA